MSGHSKWANIKHKKEKTDAQKGKIFTKIGRELAIAVREGGPDPATNGKLRDVVAKAKANNMPNDNIQRSIKKASGEGGNVNYEEIRYEGYGVGGAAIIADVVTDNRNRTAAEIRYIFDRNGGSLGATGCVAWMFDRKGVIVVEMRDDLDPDEMMMMALDAGAEDVQEMEGALEVTTDPAEFSAVREKLEEMGLMLLEAEISMLPQNTVALEGENAETFARLVELLGDHDDVQDVFHNADLPEEPEEE